jgi:nitrite reductase (NADH) small subunit
MTVDLAPEPTVPVPPVPPVPTVPSVSRVRPVRSAESVWTAVCRLDDLAPERGAAALVGGEQVALFRLVDGSVLAVQQRDPFSGAHVISRGIVGTRGDAPTVASPMYKQVFDLRSGRCLDGVGREPQDLRTWDVRIEGDVVLVGASRDVPAPAGNPDGRSDADDGGAR